MHLSRRRRHPCRVCRCQAAAAAAAAAAAPYRLAPWKVAILTVMNHMLFYGMLVFLTFFIIFEDDVKKACLPPAADAPLEITITIIFVLFLTEMGERSGAQQLELN